MHTGISRRGTDAPQGVALGLGSIRVHDLRHSAATLLLEMGRHSKIVSELLSHEGISITMDRHSHVAEALHREAAEQPGELLRRPEDSTDHAYDHTVT